LKKRSSFLAWILFLLTAILFGIDCRHSTEPPVPSGPDTTSHEFAWITFEFGEGNPSRFDDVAIVNDTLIYAVGEIYGSDSSGSPINPPYNFARWNGQTWQFATSSDSGYGYGELYCIYAFSAQDIWAANTVCEHWDGLKWTFYGSTRGYLGGFRIRKLWGKSSSDLYAVGEEGNIQHYDGTSWQKLASGTTADLLDVYGTPDGSTVWACGWRDLNPTVLLRIQGTQVQKVNENSNFVLLRSNSLSSVLSSICCPTGNYLFVTSNYGLYQCPIGTHGEGSRLSFSPDYFPGFPFRVRGSSDNDLLVAGEYDFIAHYNGSTWRYYEQLMTPEGHFASVDVKGNIAMAVGYQYHSPTDVRAVIAVGRRN
jgi:hypothetical protein